MWKHLKNNESFFKVTDRSWKTGILTCVGAGFLLLPLYPCPLWTPSSQSHFLWGSPQLSIRISSASRLAHQARDGQVPQRIWANVWILISRVNRLQVPTPWILCTNRRSADYLGWFRGLVVRFGMLCFSGWVCRFGSIWCDNACKTQSLAHYRQSIAP